MIQGRQQNFKFNVSINKYDTNNFVVYNGNKDIYNFVKFTKAFHSGIYFLTGIKNSGKTYLCKIWEDLQEAKFLNNDIVTSEKIFNIKKSQKYILEDLDKINFIEKQLLFLINSIIENNSLLLITSTKTIDEYDFDLLDLKSRIKNFYQFSIKQIDDKTKKKLLLKMFADRQIILNDKVIHFITSKIKNDYEEIQNTVINIEKLLNENNIKKLNINSIKDVCL